MQILNKSICYPKSETIIIPANLLGIMSKGILNQVIKEGFRGIEKELKENLKNSNKNIGDCVSTYPGRLNRRGIKKIYHAIIKKFPNDISTLQNIKIAVEKTIKKIIEDGFKSVSICGIGIDQGDIDKTIAAQLILNVCLKYDKKIEIKIVDDNKDFIDECLLILERNK